MKNHATIGKESSLYIQVSSVGRGPVNTWTSMVSEIGTHYVNEALGVHSSASGCVMSYRVSNIGNNNGSKIGYLG